MKYDTEKIRLANPLKEWLERYGIEINRKGFAKCPFHSEKTASFRVYADNTYHCFGCGAHGDVISFVMAVQNVPFEDACAFFRQGYIIFGAAQNRPHKTEKGQRCRQTRKSPR